MILDLSKVNIHVVIGATDMRKQINGLSAIIFDICELDIQDDNIFIFCGKTRKILKILYWDKNGYCLWQKKLGKDRFPWPKVDENIEEITLEKLHLLLKGIDFWKEHKRIESKYLF